MNSSPQDPQDELAGTEQPFVEHLIELRDRLVRALTRALQRQHRPVRGRAVRRTLTLHTQTGPSPAAAEGVSP